ncbi:MAG: SCO family protein [Alphaproteobacteria bacterium]|nr:SCO family protein [Alphaproteobacteria bacterium]
MNKNRLIRTLVIIVIGVLIGGLTTLYQIKSENGASTSYVAKNFGGSFNLIDHTGKEVTDKDFSGQYRLIYFGFTYCPAICPTELQKMSMVLKNLGPTGKVITPIFISVDPERDTVDVMKNYVSLFHPDLIGLTGTQEQVDKAKKGYKIYSAKVQDETMQEYTVDHSSFIYFMGPDDTLYRIFKVDDTAKDIEQYIQNHFGK